MKQAGIGKSHTLAISSSKDIVEARHTGRALAVRLGYSPAGATLMATVISELARNIVVYAREGKMEFTEHSKDGRSGICVIARDSGPGIPNVDRALTHGYSTSGSAGCGLSGLRNICDEFDIRSENGAGTQVRVVIWPR